MQTSEEQKQESLSVGALLDALREDGRIDEKEARRVPRSLPQEGDDRRHPLTHLAAQNLRDAANPGHTLTSEDLLQWLSGRCGQPFVRIDPLKINVTAVTEVMSYAFARRHRILALEATAEKVVIASAEPYVNDWEAHLQKVVRRPIERVLADPAAINRYTVEFYTLAKSVRGAAGDSAQRSMVTNFEQLLELGEARDLDANDRHVVNIVDWPLQYAFEQRASDIHIEPRREMGHVRFRIDGVLCNVYELPAAVMAAVTSRLKILGRMDVAEKRRPQDGRLKTKRPDGGEIELRLSTLPTAFGEKMVMRIFDPEVLLRSFDELGLRGQDLKNWREMIHQPHGIVLVTGPTGSGKTTTLYSSLKQIATADVNVCTIEDPIEMVEDSFNQMQAQSQLQVDFASGVRALLRQDPDIIMIGEIRDLETAEMAVQAALTGHLVLSTLHTNDAPTAITRLLELGVPPYLIRATVLGVMAQRLVRTLCPHCKKPVPVDEEGWKHLTAPWRADPPGQMYDAAGCLECRNTGFYGRQGIYEVLVMNDSVRPLVGDEVDLQAVRAQGVKQGMRTLRLSGAQKVANGETTIGEVMRVAPPPHKNR